MAYILTLRMEKGSMLTYEELDENFLFLKQKVEALESAETSADAVLFTPQELTSGQKQIVWGNIGSMAVDFSNLPGNLSAEAKSSFKQKLDIPESFEIVDYVSYTPNQGLESFQQLAARSNIGAASLEDVRNSFRIPSSDIITGANIHFFDTLKVSWLDIQSNKFVFPTPETFYNKICVSISGEEYGYTGGVVSLENVSQSNKNSLENRLSQGFCVAVAIYNADRDIIVGTGTRNPKTIYDEQVANPELKYIRIGSFFKNGNDYFFDVNPGII